MPQGGPAVLVVLRTRAGALRLFRGRTPSPAPMLVVRRDQIGKFDPRPLRLGAVLCEAPLPPAESTRIRRQLGLGDGVPVVPFLPPRAPAGDGLRRALHGARERARRVRDDARESERRLKALSAVVRSTGRELEVKRIVELAMSRIGLFVKVRGWALLLTNASQGALVFEHGAGEGMAGLVGATVNLGEGILGRAAQRRQVLISGRGDETVRGDSEGELPRGERARSVVAVPLFSRGRVIGVLALVDRRVAGRFSPRDARLAALLLEPVAVALDSAMLLRTSQELSVTDDLTKLYNSRYLNAALRREIERCRRYRAPVSLIFLDLDGFKNVNDQHGHLTGSRTLVEIGAVIRSTVREIDVVARFGGDEFTVILPQTGPEGALTIAERIRERIAATTFLRARGLEIRITASLGIASYPEDGRTQEDLLARADQAMYAAKAAGKDGVSVASRLARPVRRPVAL